MNIIKMIIIVIKNEIRNKTLINYYIIEIDRYFIRNYYYYYKINK